MHYYDDAPPLLKDFTLYQITIQGKSQKSAYEYFLDIRMFLRFLKIHREIVSQDIPFDEIPIDDIDADFLQKVTLTEAYAFLAYITTERENPMRRKKGISATSRARKVASLHMFFKYLSCKVFVLKSNPMIGLETPKKEQTMPKYLTVDESLELLRSVSGPYKERDFCILTLFLNCGLRVSELCGLNLSDIHDKQLTVRGKGGKSRELYLNSACVDAINAYLPCRIEPKANDKDSLFISRNRNRITKCTVELLVKKYIAAAGLDPAKYSAHKLRHTAATLMYQSTGDVRVLKEVLGHSNLNTTQIYVHVNDENIKNALESNPLANITVNENHNP